MATERNLTMMQKLPGGTMPEEKRSCSAEKGEELLTFGGHLEVLRHMLLRVLAVMGVLSVIVFCLKDLTWRLLLAPSEWNFVTYRVLERAARAMGFADFRFDEWHVELIATDLSSQFMSHITTSLLLGLLGASPYVLYELFRFIAPALYESERRRSLPVVLTVYALFLLGVLLSYYVLFPVSFRFLGTYSVAERVHSTITLDSYVSSFVTLTLLMGAVFQLPVVAFVLARMGFVRAGLLARYRRHALLLIMVVSAVITPPDLMTLVLVSVPLYLLYEVSIRVVRWTERR